MLLHINRLIAITILIFCVSSCTGTPPSPESIIGAWEMERFSGNESVSFPRKFIVIFIDSENFIGNSEAEKAGKYAPLALSGTYTLHNNDLILTGAGMDMSCTVSMQDDFLLMKIPDIGTVTLKKKTDLPLSSYKTTLDPNGYQGLEWESTPSELKTKFSTVKNIRGNVFKQINVDTVISERSFYYDDNKLYKVNIYFNDDANTSNLINALTKKYGHPSSQRLDLTKIQMQNSLSVENRLWEFKNTIITFHSEDNYDLQFRKILKYIEFEDRHYLNNKQKEDTEEEARQKLLEERAVQTAIPGDT